MFFSMRKKEHIIDILPEVEGEYIVDHQLAKYTWLGVGGPADVVFFPKDEQDLANFIKNKPSSIPMTLLGGGSNLLIRDGGIKGVVVVLKEKFFADIKITAENEITCGAGVTKISLSRFAQKNNIGGFEFLYTIPGSMGGGVRTNAGCYGRELKDIIKSVNIVDRNGEIQTADLDDLCLDYRNSTFPSDWIITSFVLTGYKEDSSKIKDKMNEFKEKRNCSQPTGIRTAGSTFKNPKGLKAWQLIQRAGCNNLVIGGAKLSHVHCNFIENFNNATAKDIEDLGDEIIKQVKKHTGIILEWEVKRIGVKR
jgi:UDP-N-acetylmuramate dehydrogenase